MVSSLALRGERSEFKPGKKAKFAVVNGSWDFKLYIYICMSLQRTFDSDDRIVFYEFFVCLICMMMTICISIRVS